VHVHKLFPIFFSDDVVLSIGQKTPIRTSDEKSVRVAAVSVGALVCR